MLNFVHVCHEFSWIIEIISHHESTACLGLQIVLLHLYCSHVSGDKCYVAMSASIRVHWNKVLMCLLSMDF